jgi:hypothetical protein
LRQRPILRTCHNTRLLALRKVAATFTEIPVKPRDGIFDKFVENLALTGGVSNAFQNRKAMALARHYETFVAMRASGTTRHDIHMDAGEHLFDHARIDTVGEKLARCGG